MTSLQPHDKYISIRDTWIKSARLIVDYKSRSVMLNEPMYKLLGSPDSVGLFYDNDNIFIMPNGLMPLNKNVFKHNIYEIRNSRTLVKNIQLLFDIDNNEEKTLKYRLYKTINTYYFNGVIINMRR